jgi:ribonuclease HII
MVKLRAFRTLENAIRRMGFNAVAGVDEVGCGCLAGPVVAAASIVAKVTRDRMMLELHARDPRYGFDRHKGYATREHLDAVSRFGYSDAHRRTFRPPSLFDRMA